MSDIVERLRERVARKLALETEGSEEWWTLYMRRADAAIALVLEEAARVAEMLGGSVRKGNIIEALYVPPTAKDIAAAIRAMKEHGDA